MNKIIVTKEQLQKIFAWRDRAKQAEKERNEWKIRTETAKAVISDLRTKLAKSEHDRKRYKARIEKLQKEERK